ncbi:hypothetical protein Tco_0479813, partial [Tanacetum coccineum]
IHTCADVSRNRMKNVIEESVETSKKVNKGVFGTTAKRKEHDVSGVDAKEKSERRQTKDPSVGNAGNTDPIIDYSKIINSNSDCEVMHKNNSNT